MSFFRHLPCLALIHFVQAAEPIDQQGRLNVCAPPYFADPTGKRDSTEAIVRALDDITTLTRRSYQQTLEEISADSFAIASKTSSSKINRSRCWSR